jgi:hypothetical protein
VVGSALGTLAVAHLLLLAPMVAQPPCAAAVHVNRYMAYPFNCDSPLMLRMAHHPGLVIEPRNVRQSRPGYVALSGAATAVVGPVADALGVNRAYGQRDDAYAPLVLINFVIAAVAVALLGWLLRGLGASVAVTVSLCAVLAANDVSKAFFWTPHQQMFALLVPLLTVVAVRWVLVRRPSWRMVAVAGFALGAATLVYASVLITVAAVAVALLARGLRAAIAPLAALAVSVALLPLEWIVVCRAVAGSYYNEELTTYHEFVWLVERVAPGDPGRFERVKSFTLFTVREVLDAAAPMLLALAAVVAVAVLARVRLVPADGRERSTVVGAGLAVLCALAFCWAIGIYTPRLAYHLVPAVLLLIGWVAARAAARAARLALALDVALVGLALIWIAYEVTKHGPYS